MPIITIKHEGTIYQRQIEENALGIFVMYSKGKEFWFRKDENYIDTNMGWHLVNGGDLPEFFISMIAIELEKLVKK